MKKIVIIGGGASGMAAAISALREAPHTEVVILEQKERLGKKIPATGNGRCNLTNKHMDRTCYRGEEPSFVKKGLERLGCEEICAFFMSMGLTLKSRGDYVYPRNDQALSVLLLMERELKRLGAKVHTDVSVLSVKREKGSYQIDTTNGEFQGDLVIFSTGGCASPVHGSDGSGLKILKKMGHRVISPVPALVPLEIRKFPLSRIFGVRTEGKVSLYCDGIFQGEDTGEIQITKTGISGIPVFQISRYAARGLEKKKKVTAVLDLLPDYPAKKIRSRIEEMQRQTTMTGEEFLMGLFHRKLAVLLCEMSGISKDMPIRKWTKEQTEELIRTCKRLEMTVEKTKGFEGAQVCAGGIATSEIGEDTMESLKHPGLYITGELQDIDGMCGGYNLHWAWVSGILAGRSAAKASKHDRRKEKR